MLTLVHEEKAALAGAATADSSGRSREGRMLAQSTSVTLFLMNPNKRLPSWGHSVHFIVLFDVSRRDGQAAILKSTDGPRLPTGRPDIDRATKVAKREHRKLERGKCPQMVRLQKGLSSRM